jgi:hypothetical protein
VNQHPQRVFRLASLVAMSLVPWLGGCKAPSLFVREAPKVPDSAALSDVMATVNANSDLVQNVITENATLKAAWAPPLRARVSLARPGNFRLFAETGLAGAELDVGVNEELFWYWMRHEQPPALYYCRHEDYAGSTARKLIPIEPRWLIEVMGLPRFDPAVAHDGPYAVGRRRLEVRSKLPSSQGEMLKRTIVDQASGLVVEQHLYDPAGTLVASSTMSDPYRDPATGASVPTKIEVDWPARQMSFKLELRDVQVNQMNATDLASFTPPSMPGAPIVDLGRRSDATVRVDPTTGAAEGGVMPSDPAAAGPVLGMPGVTEAPSGGAYAPSGPEPRQFGPVAYPVGPSGI